MILLTFIVSGRKPSGRSVWIIWLILTAPFPLLTGKCWTWGLLTTILSAQTIGTLGRPEMISVMAWQTFPPVCNAGAAVSFHVHLLLFQLLKRFLICFRNGGIRFYTEPYALTIFRIKEVNKKPKCFFLITTHPRPTHPPPVPSPANTSLDYLR